MSVVHQYATELLRGSACNYKSKSKTTREAHLHRTHWASVYVSLSLSQKSTCDEAKQQHGKGFVSIYFRLMGSCISQNKKSRVTTFREWASLLISLFIFQFKQIILSYFHRANSSSSTKMNGHVIVAIVINYTAVPKFGVGKFFYVFERSLINIKNFFFFFFPSGCTVDWLHLTYSPR